MKKVFLFLTMLLFAFTGVTRANVQQNRDDQVIEQGFEDGLGDWTMNNCHSSSGPTSSYGGNTGNYAFRFYYTTNYPQYLISPELDDNDGVNFTFYAARYSSNYPETFKVGYSSTTNDPTEFTWGSEVTCTTMYGAGAYEEYSYDFPAGTKYVSIACTSNDQFYLFVDDITVTATEPAPAPTPGEIVEVTIGDPTSTEVSSYIPGYTLYDYAISQQIYTADEIGVAGTIETLTMWLKNNSSYARNINVYMKEVEATEFASNTAWESFTAADMVASFTMPNGIDTPIEVALPLSTPFEYSGNDNLVICFQDVTGSWSSGLGGVVMDAAGNQAIYAYRDGTVYDPSNPGVNGTLLAKKNVIRLSIMTGGGEPTAFSTIPAVLDLGYRPNGAWMAPYVFNMKSNVGAVTVNALDFSGNYFTYNAELPATVSGNNPLEVAVSTGTAEAGEVSSTITVLYGENRDAEQFEITAIAYDPVEGDVVENAIEVEMEAQTEVALTLPDEIYYNYETPNNEQEAADAVYKVTFDEDAILYAGGDGNITVYTEDFNGQAGPMVDNNYEYNGPTINPGPMSMWFSYNYTGTNTFFGPEVGGGMIFGYRITPAMLQELGLGNCAITTVEAAARGGSYYDLVILKGGETPDLNNMVYYQEFDAYTPYYFFDVNLDEPQFLGDDENIWVMFYSDSPYAAYCGRQPVDAANSKIWYTTNLSTWYSSTTYTPVIYTRFLELPTGREVTVNLADMTIRESKGATGELAAVEGNVMNVAKAQMHRGNRDTETLTVHDGTATNGNVPFYGFYGDAYLKCEMVYPAAELADMAGGTINSMTFYASQTSVSWGNANQQVFVTEVADASISEFAGPGTVVFEGALSIVNGEMVVNFTTPYTYNGGNLLVGVYNTATGSYVTSTWYGESVTGASGSGYNYNGIDGITFTQRNFLPKTTFAYESSTPVPPTPPTPPTPEPFDPSFEVLFEGMVPAGTYYIVATGTELNLAYDYVPVPEQAVVYAPVDGENNVEAPYLAEWILGDYTTEMQILLGTQYPPQTVFMDWTDYLVESAFIMDLEPNQSYFMQVNERNAAGTTMGEIVAFTTPIDPVEGLEVEEDELYPGEAAVFTWEANRAFKGYNLYMDGVKVNESLITTNTYAVEGLEYNMEGYAFQVSAVYDAGESALSDEVTVYMTGNGTVSGHAYDKPDEDSEAMPIAFALVEFSGVDEYGDVQTFVLTTDEEGAFTGDILAGEYAAAVVTEGYDYNVVVEGIEVNYNELTEGIDIYTHEFYYPLQQIKATEQVEENNVLVEWAFTPAEMIVDFETGDFSQADFTLPAQYPWAITTTHPYEGTYAMKSTCEGVSSASSSIEATVDVPYDGKMGFWVKVSSETNYDKFHFYIDGVEQGSALSGDLNYQYKEYSVTEGTHTYKWEYTKDSSVNSNDDCVYVDNITMYRMVQPTPPPAPGDVVVKLTAPDIWGDGTGYQMLLDDTHSLYGTVIPETGALSTSCSGNEGIYNQFSHKIPTNADGSCSTSNIVYMSTVEITIPSGIYDWCITNPTPGDRIWIAAGNGNVGGRQDDYVFEGGHTYEFTVSMYGSNDGVDVTITGDKGVIASDCAERDNTKANFDCKVADPAMLANRVEGPIQKVIAANRGNRTFQSFNLYRRNNIVNEEPTLIAEGLTAESYTDEGWATLSYGEYQWGIQATYDGYAVEDPERVIDANAESCGTAIVTEPAREMWDLEYSFTGTSAGQQAVATDGNFIYTASWQTTPTGGYTFYKYTLDGTFVEGFNITGATGIRDLTYDGEYFYGTSGGANIFCIDLANKTLVSTINCSGLTSRHISYDPERDGFWSGNWSTLALYSRTGALIQNGPAPTSAYGSAYYKDSDNVEHLFLFCQPNSDAKVYDYNITTNTLSSSPVFDFAATPGFDGIAGGCFIAEYNEKVCWFGNSQQDPNLIGIYELESATPGPVPPTPVPTGAGLSEILWSNVIEKDMESTMTFNVSLNNGQSPVGAIVKVVNEGGSYTAAVDEFGVAELVVRKGVADTISVAFDGYTTWEPEGNPIFVEDDTYTFDVMLQEVIGPVAGLYVSPTGWAIWEGTTAGGGVTPPTPPTGGGSFTEGFENGMPADWNVIDDNNDGWTWCMTSDIPSTWTYYASMTLDWYRTGSNAICSGSYINGVGALTPDEYLVTPQVTIGAGSTFSFWAAATDASYPADHFGVFVSDNGTSNWTSVQEWTLTGKGGANGGRASRDGDGAKLGTWYNYNVDLSSYAGNKYIAIRHFNCNDQYIMCVDDIEFNDGSKGNRAPISYKMMLDGKYVGETEYPFFQFDVEGMEEGETHVGAVAPLFASGMGDWMEYEWTYTACSNFSDVTEFTSTVNNNVVTLNWTLPGGSTPTPPGGGDTFDEGFESGMPSDWTVIDGNNDGWTWCMTSAIPSTWTYYATMTLDWYRTGTNAICSGSYINGVGALTPNDYLVMGQHGLVAGSTLSFWAAATDAGYPADHFGVFVSDDATNWDMVNEWTLTAKEGAAQGGRESRNGNGAKLGTWYQFTADLSAYAGSSKYIAIRHFNCTDQYIMCVDDISLAIANKGDVRNNRAMWDLVYEFDGTSGYQYGVASDGENIYTSSWSASSSSMFYKYDMQGNFIEEFNISGCGQLRGMTYDGEYFYGVANSSTVYCVDLANKTLAGTFTTSYGAMRAITYDPERDGFWVVGNWSGALTLIDRTGAIQQVGPEPTSASDVAYYKDPEGVEHVYCFNNGDNGVYDYNITTGTLASSAVFNFSNNPNVTGSSGGCFVGAYGEKTCFFGDIQQSPQHIAIYELDGNAPVPPTPPTPVEGILGAYLFRYNNATGICEFADFFTTSETTYTETVESGDYTYVVRVVYDGEVDVTYYAMSCGDSEDVVIEDALPEYEVVNSIYPNPTSGDLHINAEAMTHVTVFNAMGQMVYDQAVNGDEMILNMAQYEAGVYMVRIDTANGSSVKRITVVK